MGEENAAGLLGLWGGAVDNTVTAINYSLGQALYDLFTWEWHSECWNEISELLWSVELPPASQITPYVATMLGVSAGAAAVAVGDIFLQLPPTVQYGIVDAILNGWDLVGGADKIRPEPRPRPPIHAPPVPGRR